MDQLTVTLREASRITGLSRSTLYKLFNQGKLTPRKVGKRTLILTAELDKFVNSLPARRAGNDA